jgi:outer membrane receptor protein involved in Fe transport
MAPALAVVLACATALGGDDPPPPADAADAPPPPRLSEEVTVTATRAPSKLVDIPSSVALLPRDELAVTAGPFADDALRQVVGFSLFRRTGSRTANPTSQGVSLRGLGASGASRALVLVDGLPQNDPFGGWVYWARTPRFDVERLEVLRGGAGDLYGSGALGGVIQIVSRDAHAGDGLEAEASAGGQATYEGAVTARGTAGGWSGRLSGEAYHTDGYVPVPEDVRGPVDTEAASKHIALDARVERKAFGDGRFFLRGQYYDEDRENGTPLTTNDTRIGLGALGFDFGTAGGRTAFRAWAQDQLYHQSFSAISADRTSEDLTRLQRVPADAFGASLQWSRPLGDRHKLLLGAEAHYVSGTTEEQGFARGVATSTLDAGGNETGAAFFAQDLIQLDQRFTATASLRFDAWWLHDGHSTTTPLSTGVATTTSYDDRDETRASPRLGIVFRAKPGLSLTASGYGAFRAPTLNELYRSFRLGDTLTLANPDLAPEKLWGGEVGALVAYGRHTLRLSLFTAQVQDAVANVTLSSVPGLITRERQNVGSTRSSGLEAEFDLRFGARYAVTAGYAFTDATVHSFPADPTLEGLQLPQIPRHQATLQARREGRLQLGLQARWTGAAYEDDRNTLTLDDALQVDLLAAYELGGKVTLFASAENLFDAEIVAARTPVPSLAPPRLLRAGVRVRAFH